MAKATVINGFHLTPGMSVKEFIDIAKKLGCTIKKTRGGQDITYYHAYAQKPQQAGKRLSKDAGKLLINWLKKAVLNQKREEKETMATLVQKVHAALELLAKPATKTEVAKAAGVTEKQAIDSFSHLRNRGIIVHTSENNKKQKIYWIDKKEAIKEEKKEEETPLEIPTKPSIPIKESVPFEDHEALMQHAAQVEEDLSKVRIKLEEMTQSRNLFKDQSTSNLTKLGDALEAQDELTKENNDLKQEIKSLKEQIAEKHPPINFIDLLATLKEQGFKITITNA